MKKIVVLFAAFAAVLAHAQTPAPSAAPAGGTRRVATINVQQALIATKEGQKAAQDLQTKFNPRRQALEKRQSDLQAMQQQARAGAATMSQAAKEKLARDIDSGTRTLKNDSEDFDSEVQQEEGKVMNVLGQKLMEVVQKYTQANGIGLVFDVSNQQSPVLWADASIDITSTIVKLYDEANPGASAAPGAPATPPAAAAPATPPAAKKQ